MYRPLDERLTIQDSEIDGQGLFAKAQIPKWECLGETHFKNFMQDIIRTPLGGFYNHSEEPNCVKRHFTNPETGITTYKLYTLREIQPGEELTVKYTFYELT